MTDPRPRKPRKRKVPKFGQKRRRPKSWCTPPDVPEGQIDLDFVDGDLPQEAVELFN